MTDNLTLITDGLIIIADEEIRYHVCNSDKDPIEINW